MNRDAPREIIDAARFNEAGPFRMVYTMSAVFTDAWLSMAGGAMVRVQYFPKNRHRHQDLLSWRAIHGKGTSAYDRGEAWEILSKQQIPGCPDDGQNRWRKMHTENYWAWYYEAGT